MTYTIWSHERGTFTMVMGTGKPVFADGTLQEKINDLRKTFEAASYAEAQSIFNRWYEKTILQGK